MLLQLLNDYFDGLVELRVVPLAECCWIEIDIVVRRDAVILDLPFAIEAIDRGTRRGDAAAVEKFGIAADADQPSPCSLSHERPDARFAEVPRQRVAAGAGHFIDDHHLGSVDGFRRARPVVALAGNDFAHQWTAEVIDNVISKLPAFIKAFVDDGSFLPNLRE